MISAGRCRIIGGDVSDLKHHPQCFDLVTASEAIYFWPGLEDCFRQVAKVLKPGGVFLICNESDGLDATRQKFAKIIDRKKVYTTEQIETALKSAGFTVIS